jgi:hypothetical protein
MGILVVRPAHRLRAGGAGVFPGYRLVSPRRDAAMRHDGASNPSMRLSVSGSERRGNPPSEMRWAKARARAATLDESDSLKLCPIPIPSPILP